MILIITLLILTAVIGIPTYIIYKIIKNIDKETITPSSDIIQKKLHNGYLISFWGIDLMFASVPVMICSCYTFFDSRIELAVLAPMLFICIGSILLIIGRVIIGCQTRRINFIKGRERTPLEEWVLGMMSGIESKNTEALFTQVARATNNKVDDITSISVGMPIIFKLFEIGKVFTGKNFFKIHWPWILTLLTCISLLIVKF